MEDSRPTKGQVFAKADAIGPNVPFRLRQLHDLLSAFMDIHNDVFARSVRRLIPIPGIFKPIDFAGHAEDLAIIGTEIDTILRVFQSLEEEPRDVRQAIASVQAYSQALRDAVVRLQAICERLKAKAEGHDYAMDEYKADVAAYHRSTNTYDSLGDDMNAAFPFLLAWFNRKAAR